MENQNYFEKILNGEMITEDVKTKRGVFTIKNITSKDHIKIAVADYFGVTLHFGRKNKKCQYQRFA